MAAIFLLMLRPFNVVYPALLETKAQSTELHKATLSS